jgi:hypothetical protein
VHTVLYQQGDPGKAVYYHHRSVNVWSMNGNQRACQRGPDLVGEMAISIAARMASITGR